MAKRDKKKAEVPVEDAAYSIDEQVGEPLMSDGGELQEALRIDPVNIKSEFVHLPGQVAHYGELAAQALYEQMRAKANVKRVAARVYLALKQEADAVRGDGRRYTEANLAAMVETHPEVVLAHERHHNAELNKARAYAALEAWRAKRDALVSITGHVRDERRAMNLAAGMDEDGDED